MTRLRVLVVDDSLFMRAAIKKIIEGDPRFEVVGVAKDGAEGVTAVEHLKPDVVTMDFNMPTMNGAEAVRAIMQQRPTPVVMFSAHTRQGARETFDALSAGAVDFVTKPAGEVSVDLSKITSELISKLTAASQSRPRVASAPMIPRPSGQISAVVPPGAISTSAGIGRSPATASRTWTWLSAFRRSASAAVKCAGMCCTTTTA